MAVEKLPFFMLHQAGTYSNIVGRNLNEPIIIMKRIIILTFLILPAVTFSRDNSKNLQKSPSADTSIFPVLNKQWTAAEFQEVLNTIIDKQKKDSLNIFSAAYPGLFEKITSYDNYWFLESRDYLVNDKIPLNLTFSGLVKTILQNYYQKGLSPNGKLVYEKEVAHFMDLLCKITSNQSDLTDQFVKANPDLTQVQLDGIKKLNTGIAIMLNGLLLTIDKEYKYYSEESICNLSKSFKDFYSATKNKLTVELKTEFDKKINTISTSHSNKCVRETMQKR